MKHFTHSAPSSKSTHFDNNLTPIQAAAAIALGFGLEIPAVAAELKIHRSTLYNWAKIPLFFKAVESANAEFQKQFRTQIAMLTRLAVTNIQQILSDTEASPSVRLKAALAVLNQDWKLPNSTEFDTNSEESDSLRNEMPPEFDEPQQPVQSAQGREARRQSEEEQRLPPRGAGSVVREFLKSEKVGRNEPCPCGSTLKYKRCCGNPVHGHSTDFDTPLSMK
ncbi:MAG: SEC-C domain-containing protein [Bryobacterales bacterium]|nr:SEC-C domain-containing protein [Bryobacterales bacterium]